MKPSKGNDMSNTVRDALTTRSPYDNAAAALHLLRSRGHISRSDLQQVIGSKADYHQVMRVWKWLLDWEFAVVSGNRASKKGPAAQTICLTSKWKGHDND